LIGKNTVNLIVGWGGQFLFFVVLCQFSQVVGEWPENQILIPDWTYFYCPGAALVRNRSENFFGGKTFVEFVGAPVWLPARSSAVDYYG